MTLRIAILGDRDPGNPNHRATEAALAHATAGGNPAYHATLLERGLPIVGTGDEGELRILELPDHPFFVATLFVPQARSRPGAAHPLVVGLLAAAAQLRS